MFKWLDHRFKKEGESLEDQRRSGRPKTALANASIKRLNEIEENQLVTNKEIWAETSLHPPSIKEILHVSLT